MTREIETPHGPARVHLHAVEQPVGSVVLGHGAGGGVSARDLLAATDAARSVGFTVALVEQPYRVAGRRSPAPAGQLDVAWNTVLVRLREEVLPDGPIVTGGRSAGARVACRNAEQNGAAGVLCLAFPLVPPRRATSRPAQSRLPELDGVPVPVLVVQGRGDPFGMPPPGKRRKVVTINGNHSLSSDLDGLRTGVRDWLAWLTHHGGQRPRTR